jgi:uncharacterized protein (DUF1330 family)
LNDAKACWVAHISVTDPARSAGYQDIAPAAFRKYYTRFLARGGNTEDRGRERHVVIGFDTREQASTCNHSNEYQQARGRRDTVQAAEQFSTTVAAE